MNHKIAEGHGLMIRLLLILFLILPLIAQLQLTESAIPAFCGPKIRRFVSNHHFRHSRAFPKQIPFTDKKCTGRLKNHLSFPVDNQNLPGIYNET
jgi:hypothetical protein